MNESKTHPELTVVSRILQQASIPLTQAQFDQQWTATQLRTAFNWTRHLSAMFLALDDNLSSLSAGQQVLTPQRIVKSFLKSRESAIRQYHININGDNHSSSSSSSLLTTHLLSAVILPTESELLDPSAALQRRLLSNVGLTDMARLEILSLNCSQQQQQRDGSSFEINSDAMSIIKENALEDLIAGARTHFLQLSRLPGVDLSDLQGDILSNMTTKSTKQRAKARVLFNRIEASNDTIMEVEMVLIPQLRKYLEVSRSEAWDVICALSDMATKAIRALSISSASAEGVERSKVDWEAVVDALTRLQYE
ncbi:hypothetical protein K457DRAFT_14751 [Linnemannia elongata AG-77]|uniref:Uncharacterized protein n=1 Tax=Linnemannia elongata AG-77 TaxID=1314771 RepID=A0A197KAV4_9FUNG|nr:hypothetical protein K457DRAFT_14751 [Linnemannia elongata AG-77]